MQLSWENCKDHIREYENQNGKSQNTYETESTSLSFLFLLCFTNFKARFSRGKKGKKSTISVTQREFEFKNTYLSWEIAKTRMKDWTDGRPREEKVATSERVFERQAREFSLSVLWRGNEMVMDPFLRRTKETGMYDEMEMDSYVRVVLMVTYLIYLFWIETIFLKNKNKKTKEIIFRNT